MSNTVQPAPVPVGFVRHPVSGCLVHTTEERAHSEAFAQRQAIHATLGRDNSTRAQLVEARATLAATQAIATSAVAKAEELAARLAKLEAGSSQAPAK